MFPVLQGDWRKFEVNSLKAQISEIESSFKDGEESPDVGTLVALGNLRRDLAVALWYINKAQDALQQIQLCVSEGSHQFSEQTAYRWMKFADERNVGLPEEKQTTIIGYEISVLFLPPHDVLKKSLFSSKMLSFCCEAGQSFQKKATQIVETVHALKMEAGQSEDVAKFWMGEGKKFLSSSKGRSLGKKMAKECFSLALKFLPSDDNKTKAKLLYSRATAILSVDDSAQLALATSDANTYVKLRPSAKGYSLLCKCHLYAHHYKDAMSAFRNAQETLKDQEEKYKEFHEFFRTAISQKAFEVFKEECPVPDWFVHRLINESVAKRAVQDLSVLFCEGWAAECDASHVPLDMVLEESDVENREKLVRILLEQKARPGGLPTSSRSPLTVCLQTDNSDMAVVLLQHGADVNDLIEKDGGSALHASFRIGLKKGNNFAIFLFLLERKKYPVDQQDKDGNTLLHILCRGKIDSKKQEAINILLEAGANPLITNSEMKKPIDLLSKLSDNRRKLLLSVQERFKLPSPTPKQESPSGNDKDKKKKQLPKRANNLPFSGGSEPSSPSLSIVKEPLTVVRQRILSLIGKLDISSWIKKAVSLEKVKTTSVKSKKPDLENDPKPQIVESENSTLKNSVSRLAQDNEGDPNPHDENNGASVSYTPEEGLDGLPWEVVQSPEVEKLLNAKRMEPWIEKLFFQKVQNLAQGRDNWTSHLCKRLKGLPKKHGMLLYEARLTDDARIIWECAISFSPRYSDKDTESKTTIYSEVIRIWDIVFDHANLEQAIEKIVTSFTRGQNGILKKELKGLPRKEGSKNHGPNLYVKRDQGNLCVSSSAFEVQTNQNEAHNEQVTYFPPASHQENEFQVLKFYDLSTAVIWTLQKQRSSDVEIDFPFRVEEEEHDIINFHPSPPSSIILIGRSGTGKTTCILYRLWKDFFNYWDKAKDAGPWIPKRIAFLPKDNSDSNSSNFEEGDLAAATTSQQEDGTQNAQDGGGTHADDCEEATEWTEAVESGPMIPKRTLFLPKEISDSDLSNFEEGHLTGIPGGQSDETQSSCVSELPCVTSCEANCPENPYATVEAPSETRESLEHLHQLFVTKSGVLCKEIQKHFNALSQACPFVKHVTEQDATPFKLQDADDSRWPLFLNARALYVILDASLPEPSFFPRNEDGSLETRAQDWGEEDNQLCTIPVIDDYEDSEDEDADYDTDEDNKDQHEECERSMVLVSYSVFESQLWSKMCKKKKHVNFHPSLVWMEIRSFIKGSHEALHTKGGHLSRKEYKKIGQKRAANFTEEDRGTIYNLFESYEWVKKSLNMFDENDLVFHLYHRLRQCIVPDWSIHNLYVDETQDFTQAELMLLIRCCRDPNGIFLTGDTAQSVMQGISFRFEDLRSLFYYLNENCKAVGAQAEVTVPKVMPLIHNYRSHNGILNLASSVVSILQKYFPESFDKLAKDQGQLDGPKPVLLGSCSQSDLAIILRGNKRKTTTIEFGAHQAILVKSDDARNKLHEDLSHALVLTIFEAKGLEFDDVLVYNFFKDSQASTESLWGVVTQYLLDAADCKTVNTSNIKSRPLQFDPDKHQVLNSELKQLYTAVTRARAKVWFFDEDEENRRPMFEYFEQLGLAEVVRLEEGSAGAMSLENMFPKKSSEEDWEKQGTYFFNKKAWNPAERCFTKSGNTEMSQKCKAYVQADYARSLHSEPRQQKDEFIRAADQFLQCNMIQEAKACLLNARERNLYATLLQKLGKERNAARTFERNGNFLEAGHCLEVISDYDGAVEVLLRGRLYSSAIDVLRRFNLLTPGEQKLTSPPRRTLDELYLALAEFHSRGGKTEKMNGSLQQVKSINARVDFLKKHRLFEDAADELHKDGRSVEAANVMRENGQFLLAADYARTSGDSSLAADCIFAYTRSESTISKKDQDSHLEEAKKLYKETKRMNSLGEVLLQQAKLTQDQSKILEAKNIFTQPAVSNTCGELECEEFLCETASDGLHIKELIKNGSLVRLVERVKDLIFSLNVRDPGVGQQKTIDKCEEYFGLCKGDDDTKRVVRHKEGVRFLLISRELEKQSIAGGKWEMALEDARARIGENLCQRIARLIPQVRLLLSKAISSNETCQRFLLGIPCDHGSDYQHSLPSNKEADALFWALSNTVHLDSLVNDLVRHTVHGGAFQRPLAELRKCLPRDSFQSCIQLENFFFPPAGVSSTVRMEKYTDRVRRNKILKKSLYKFAEELWKTRSTHKDRISDLNLFLRVSNLLQLIGLPPETILSWIKKEEDLFLSAHGNQITNLGTAQSAGMVSDPQRWTLFARRWEDSKRMLHVYGNILGAGHHALRRFLKLTASPGRRLPFPSPRNSLAILEYHMCVHLALLSARSFVVLCFPRSYLSLVTFWDALNCSLPNHLRVYGAVQICPWYFPRTARAVRKFLSDMVSIMLGGHSSKFNVLEKALRTMSCIESGEAERAVILVLTMLCNCGLSIPPENESILLRNLCASVPDEDALPERVRSCLQQVRQATGIRQIVVILQNLLSKKQDDLCNVRWKRTHGRLWWDQLDPSAYPETFNTNVLESFSQETPDNPPEEVPESEAEEHGPPVEPEGFLRDLDPERSERLHAIEREEALQAKSWKEEIAPDESVPAGISNGEENSAEDVSLPFRNVKLDESGCGICNVIFSSKEQDISDSNTEEASESGYSDDFAKDRDSHLDKNSPHHEKERQFEDYKGLFSKEMMPVVSKVEILVKKVEDQVRMADQQNDLSFGILNSRLNELKTARSSLTEVTSKIERECEWGDTKSLKQATASLRKAFSACQEEMRKQNARQAEVWNVENQPEDVKEGEHIHVRGLKKKK